MATIIRNNSSSQQRVRQARCRPVAFQFRGHERPGGRIPGDGPPRGREDRPAGPRASRTGPPPGRSAGRAPPRRGSQRFSTNESPSGSTRFVAALERARRGNQRRQSRLAPPLGAIGGRRGGRHRRTHHPPRNPAATGNLVRAGPRGIATRGRGLRSNAALESVRLRIAGRPGRRLGEIVGASGADECRRRRSGFRRAAASSRPATAASTNKSNPNSPASNRSLLNRVGHRARASSTLPMNVHLLHRRRSVDQLHDVMTTSLVGQRR